MSDNESEKSKPRKLVQRTIEQLRWTIRGTKVFALVGKSGTGKSFRAKLVADKFGIHYIIDDGLLIKDNAIITGRSAKKEKNYVGAIRTALFDDEVHRKQLLEAFNKEKPSKVLLIGTSEKMVAKMSVRLELPPIDRMILIEEIASKEEIERAITSRNEGKHVIPVPAIEVEQDYSHILIDSIKIWFRTGFMGRKKSQVVEKSVVRPDFDNRTGGHVGISEAALSQMVLHCIDEFNCDLEIHKIRVKRKGRESWSLKVLFQAEYGHILSEEMHNLRKYIVEKIERFTGIMLEDVTLTIDKIKYRKKDPTLLNKKDKA